MRCIAALLFVAFSANAATNETRFEECRGLLKSANAAGILRDMTFDRGRPPEVVVGPSFFRLELKARQGVVRAANCLFMAGEEGCIDFNLLHYQTGKAVARNRLCRYEPL